MKPLSEVLRPSTDIKLSPAPAARPAAGAALRLGQVLNATVLGANSRETLTLRVAGQKLQAQSPQQWPAGSKLLVRVASKTSSLIELQVLPRKASSPAALSADALRWVLPKKMPLSEALPPLLRKSPDPGVQSKLQPANQRLSETLLKVDNTLSAKNLRSAALGSGLFMESRLAKAVLDPALRGENLTKDLKATLLQLRSELAHAQHSASSTAPRPQATPQHSQTPNQAPSPNSDNKAVNEQRAPAASEGKQIPPETAAAARPTSALPALASLPKAIRLLEAGIANIESQQLFQSADNERPNAPSNLNIPLLLGDEVTELQLRIHRDNEENAESSPHERQWTLDFQLDTQTLGEIAARVSFSSSHLDLSVFAPEKSGFEDLEREWSKLELALQTIDVPQVKARLIAGPNKDAKSQSELEPILNLTV